jgi:hypothetical protein
VLFAFVIVRDVAAGENFAEEKAEEAVADDAAAHVLDGVLFGELAVAGGSVQFLSAVGENFETDGVERAELAVGRLIFALDGFEATDVGESGEVFGDMRLDAGEEEDAGG